MNIVGLGINSEGLVAPVGLLGEADSNASKLLCFAQETGIDVLLDGFDGIKFIETDPYDELQMNEFNSKVVASMNTYVKEYGSVILHVMHNDQEEMLFIDNLDFGSGVFLNYITGEETGRANSLFDLISSEDFEDELIEYSIVCEKFD